MSIYRVGTGNMFYGWDAVRRTYFIQDKDQFYFYDPSHKVKADHFYSKDQFMAMLNKINDDYDCISEDIFFNVDNGIPI